jgi:hypothetical protein
VGVEEVGGLSATVNTENEARSDESPEQVWIIWTIA